MKESMITFLGDVYPAEGVCCEVPYKNAVINLEAPLYGGVHAAPEKINLKGSVTTFSQLFAGKLLACNLANNHISDYLDEGVEKTIEHLVENNLRSFGVGQSEEEALKPLIVDFASTRVALVGLVCSSTSPVFARNANYGVAGNTLQQVIKSINKAKAGGADRIVVNFHWGPEETMLPKQSDVSLAREVVDAGADLIIGHHTHCIQPYEVYKGKYIFYSLGNCIFPNFSAGSNYDAESGKFLGKYTKRQESWNQYSLAVRWNPSTAAVSVDKLRYDGVGLRIVSRDSKTHYKSIKLNKVYELKYKIAYVIGKYRGPFVRFMREPKLLNFGHVKFAMKTVFRDSSK